MGMVDPVLSKAACRCVHCRDLHLGLVNAYIAIAVAYTPASIVVVGHHPLLLGFVNFLLDIPYKLVETRCFGLCVLKGESVESIPFVTDLV